MKKHLWKIKQEHISAYKREETHTVTSIIATEKRSILSALEEHENSRVIIGVPGEWYSPKVEYGDIILVKYIGATAND